MLHVQCVPTCTSASCCDAGFEQPADVSKQMTDLIPHPTAGDTDDREAYTSAVQPADTAPSAILVGGPEYDAEPDVVDSGTTRDVGVQVQYWH